MGWGFTPEVQGEERSRARAETRMAFVTKKSSQSWDRDEDRVRSKGTHL